MRKRKTIEGVLQNMTFAKLVEEINDSIDIDMFPLGEISPIDDEDKWDEIARYVGGWHLAELCSKSAEMDKAKYFVFDSEMDEIAFFATKQDVIDYVGIAHLEEVFMESIAN